jgi:hypothetical protein
MLTPDVPVWHRFLDVYSFLFQNLYYDVLLGAIQLTTAEGHDPVARMWRQNTSRRADAICELNDEVWIVEVSNDPGLRSIGQLLTYHILWIRNPVILKPEKLLLVSSTIEKNLLDAAASYGIQVYLV